MYLSTNSKLLSRNRLLTYLKIIQNDKYDGEWPYLFYQKLHIERGFQKDAGTTSAHKHGIG